VGFEGTCAVVTGAASGIGAATAERLAAEGAFVLLADIDAGRLAGVAESIVAAGGKAQACAFDVASTEGWQTATQELARLGLRVRTLVNNAYALEVKPLHELSLESWQRQLAVDLTAVYLAVHAFHDDLVATGGSIVNVASVHAVLSWPGHPAYAASKGGMLSLTRQLAVEYGPQIRVNAVLPGPVLTAVWDAVPESARQAAGRETALGRMGLAAEVAAAITFLASDEASFVTGVSLPVDGGQTIKSRG
jgi:NAD(P)-dependent dehydrogenase (short-subunit alcohol dehydrogenase family)